MNPRRVLWATFFGTVAVQTLGNIDVGPNAPEPKRKLPPPKAYAAAVVVWAVLGWTSQISDNLARASAALGGLVLLTSLFVNALQPGRFTVAGTRLVHFFNRVAEIFSTPVPSGGASETQPPTDEGSLI